MAPSHAEGFAPPPRLLVEGGAQRLGRFAGPPERANLVDAPYLRLPRALRKLRLKEWQAIQIATPELFANLALFDAKLMQLVQVKLFDRARGEKILHEKQVRPGAFRIADQLHDSVNSYGGLAFRNRGDRIEIDIDVPVARGELVVHVGRGASQVVSLPFARDIGMYSHKGMFPIEGAITSGTTTYRLDGGLALLDDHKGYYPYVMKWEWGTAAVRDAKGRALGFNLTRNQCRDPETFNENCAWIDDRIGTLPAVTFERGAEVWTIRDREGRVDLAFHPTVPGDVRIQAVIVESRYQGPFGTFTGRLAPVGLAAIEVDGWFGMGERFWLRC